MPLHKASTTDRRGSPIVLAVLNDTLEDLAVARSAASLAHENGSRLVVAVLLPSETLPLEHGIYGLIEPSLVPPQAIAAARRVERVLEAQGIPWQVIAVPYRDRGGPRRRARRITNALLRTAWVLRAHRLVLAESASAERTAEVAAQRRTRVGITVLRADATVEREAALSR